VRCASCRASSRTTSAALRYPESGYCRPGARFFSARSSWMAPVIWLPVTVASVVATCVIRFGNTRCAQPLSCSRSCPRRQCGPAPAPLAAGWGAAATGRQVHGGQALHSPRCWPGVRRAPAWERGSSPPLSRGSSRLQASRGRCGRGLDGDHRRLLSLPPVRDCSPPACCDRASVRCRISPMTRWGKRSLAPSESPCPGGDVGLAVAVAVSMARSSTSCCQRCATWRPRSASLY